MNRIALAERPCLPCERKARVLTPHEISRLYEDLGAPWDITGSTKIRREFMFKTFLQAMAFVDRVADIAETEGHHPDIHIFYNRVILEVWTHALNGLTENDFIVAAKIEAMYNAFAPRTIRLAHA